MLKVLYVSTFKTRCGIATYTENLLTPFNKQEDARAEVAAPVTEDLNIEYSSEARFCWTKGSNQLIDAVRDCSVNKDVVHFQHEFGIFTNRDFFFAAIDAAKKNKCKVVVTLHTVPTFGDVENSLFVVELLEKADAVIVHTEEGVASISTAARRVPNYTQNKVYQIPHGTPVVSAGDKQKGLKCLGVEGNAINYFTNCTIGGAVGFIGPGKFIDSTVEIFLQATLQGFLGENHAFVIIGASSDPTSKYAIHIQNKIWFSGARNIHVFNTFIKREDMADVFAILDYGILNTNSHTLSASGQVQEHIARRIPIAVRNRPIYSDAIRAGAIPFNLKETETSSATAMHALTALATSKRVRDSVKLKMQWYSKKTSWDIIAAVHTKLYKRLLEQ